MNNSVNQTNNILLFKADLSSGENWTITGTLLSLLLGGITFATIMGNLLVLYLFWKSKRGLRTPTHYLIANLAVADLLVGVGVMPVLTSLTLNNFKWYWGDIACILREYGHFCLCGTSMVSMMAISIERYVGVRFPLRHKRILSRKRVLKVILLIWTLGFVLSATPLTVWPIQEKYPGDICPVNLTSNFVFFISVCLYWIPVTFTTVVYFCIYKRAVELWTPQDLAKVSSTQMLSSTTSRSFGSNTAFAVTKDKATVKQDRLIETRKKQIRFAKKLSWIVGIMLFLYAPLFVTFLIAGVDSSYMSPYLLLTVAWIRYFSSTVNPYLYICVVPGYKKAFFKALWNERSKLDKSRTSTDPNGSSISESESSSDRSGSPNSSNQNRITFNPSPIIDKKVRASDDIIKNGVVIKPWLVSSRFCPFCGNNLTFAGDGPSSNCSVCFKGSLPQVKFSDSTMASNKKSGDLNEETTEPESEVSCRDKNVVNFSPRKLSNLSVCQDSLVSEMRSFLAAMNQKKELEDKEQELSRRRRASQLLTNLKTEFPEQFKNEVKVQEYRKSILKEVVKEDMGKRSSFSLEIDLDAMQELDEIIKQLESSSRVTAMK